MHAPGNIRKGRNTQSGSSLLEVLIAVLVLAIGMLGIAALQAVTLRNTQSSSDRTTAVIQAYSMLDMLRANADAARAGNYDRGFICEAPAGDSRITGDLGRWINQMQAAMGPSACGSIDCGTETCAVSVRWDDSRATGDDAEQTEQIATTETRI